MSWIADVLTGLFVFMIGVFMGASWAVASLRAHPDIDLSPLEDA